MEERQVGNPSNLRSTINRPPKKHDKNSQVKVAVKNLSAKWDDTYEVMTLTDISFEVQRGQLLAIIGPVGCGKVKYSLRLKINFNLHSTCKEAYVS